MIQDVLCGSDRVISCWWSTRHEVLLFREPAVILTAGVSLAPRYHTHEAVWAGGPVMMASVSYGFDLIAAFRFSLYTLTHTTYE